MLQRVFTSGQEAVMWCRSRRYGQQTDLVVSNLSHEGALALVLLARAAQHEDEALVAALAQAVHQT